MAEKIHPRLLFIPENSNADAFGIKISQVRSKAISDANYRGYIQELITELDSQWYGKPLADDKIHITFNCINFAFLYMLDPATVPGLTAEHTKDEYGDEAIRQALHLAGKINELNAIETGKRSWIGIYQYDYGSKKMTGPDNLALAIVNDWVNDRVTKTERQEMVTAIEKSFIYRYPQDFVFAGDHKFYGAILEDGLGVIGFYGDDIDDAGETEYRDTMQILMDEVVHKIWLKSIVTLHNRIFDGAKVLQGMDYDLGGFKDMALGTMAVSTSLNRNLYQELHMYRDLGYYYAYMIKPRPETDGNYKYFAYADTALNAEGTDFEFGREYLVSNPVLYGLSGTPFSEQASLVKWSRDTAANRNGRPWSYDTTLRSLVTRMLFSDELKPVTGKSPEELNLPQSKALGNGTFVFRSGFNNHDDTAIKFNATKWMCNYGGHGRAEFAEFQILKYGDLTTKRNGSKKGIEGESWFKHGFGNWMAVLDPDEPLDRYGHRWGGYRNSFNVDEIDPDSPVWQIDGKNYVGDVVADGLNGVTHDYVDYLYSNAWGTNVTYSEREFVYLRSMNGSNDEYVVVYDRIESSNSDAQKFYQLQIPFDANVYSSNNSLLPWIADANGGKWTISESSSTRNNIVESINTWSGNNSHGKIYNKTLLPSVFEISKTGGPDHYYEDIEGRPFFSPTAMTDKQKNYMGAYTIRIKSDAGEAFEKFLNVMQIGDSNTLTEMTETVGISATTGSTGTLKGAHIKDETKNRIVLFNDQKRADTPFQKAPYVYSCDVTATSNHLITNIEPLTEFRVSDGTRTIATAASSADGVLTFNDSFNSSGNVTYTVTKTGDLPLSISIITPNNQTVTSAGFTVTGSATASNGKTVTSVSIPGGTVGADDGAWNNQTELWSAELTLSEGVNNLTFTAHDSAGETSEATISVILATPVDDDIDEQYDGETTDSEEDDSEFFDDEEIDESQDEEKADSEIEEDDGENLNDEQIDESPDSENDDGETSEDEEVDESPDSEETDKEVSKEDDDPEIKADEDSSDIIDNEIGDMDSKKQNSNNSGCGCNLIF